MERKLIIFAALVGLCVAVFARNNPVRGEQIYLAYQAKQDSIQAFHEAQRAESNQKNVGVEYQGAISGTVYESDGVTPIPDAAVIIWDASWTTGFYFYTDDFGHYLGNVYSSGTYYVTASGYVLYGGYEYNEEYYNESAEKSGADPVTVASPDTTIGIDFTLTRRGAISGTVTEDDGVTPIYDTWIDLLDLEGECLGSAQTNADGFYTITGVSTGNFFVKAQGYVTGMPDLYTTEYYDNQGSLGSANQVSVTSPNTTTGIDFALTRGGYLLNTMTEPSWAGQVSTDPDKWLYPPGDVVTLGMGYVYPGYQFDHWSGDVSGTDTTVQITMNADHSVTAHLVPEPPPGAFLAVNINPVGAGEVSRDPLNDYYDYGTVVTLDVLPGEGWVFRQWSGDKEGINDPDTVVMNRDKIITANFGHTLETWTHPEGMGSVTRYPDLDIYEHGQMVQVWAYPPEGYSFSYWDGDLEGENNPAYISMNSDKEVIAKFECNQKILIMQVYPEGAGTTTPEPGEHIYETGDTVALSATSAEGYKFWMWKCSVADPYDSNTTVIMNTNETVTAKFQPTGHTLETWVHPEGSGEIEIAPNKDVYEDGEGVQLTAYPAEGYQFKCWDGDLEGSENPAYLTMNSDKEVIAKFETVEVSLTMKVDPEVGGTTDPPPGSHTYVRGDTIDITALPNSGYRFKRWNCLVGNYYDPTTYVVMIDNEIVTAKFELIPEKVTLTIQVEPSEGGTTEPGPGSHQYNKNQVVNLTAIPEDGYRFVKWLGSVADAYDSTTTVSMNENKTVKALFESITVTLTMCVDPEEGGTTEPPPGLHTYERGDTVDISAIPSIGYAFIEWKCEVFDHENQNTKVIMDECDTVTATFGLQRFLLTMKVKPEEGGVTEPIVGIHDYDYGEVVNLAAEPEEGYRFAGWQGVVSDSDSVHTTVTMDSNKTLQANFEKIQYMLTILVDPEGSGNTEPHVGEYKYNAGDTVQLSAFPIGDDYRFSCWSGNVQDLDSIHIFVIMHSNQTVAAHFTLADEISPFLKNCFPCPQASAIPKNTKIKFWTRDHETGVDLSSLDAWINELQILDGGVDVTGGHVSIVTGNKGYKVTFRSDEGFEEGNTVTVHAIFSDFALPPNQCDSSYSFKIGTAKVDSAVSDIIGEEGGTLVDVQSGVQINIPANALEDSIEIIIDRVQDPPPLPEGFEGVATPYHFGPDGLQFNAGVVIQIPYTLDDLEEAGVTNPLDLRLFYFHVTSGEWIELEIDSVNTGQKIIYVTVNEFCYLSFGCEETTEVDHEIQPEATVPTEFSLSQNYPNPFNPETHIQYSVPEPCHVTLEVYNMAGQLILILVREQKSAGIYKAVWNGRDENGTPMPTGLYFIRFRAMEKIFVRKVSLLK